MNDWLDILQKIGLPAAISTIITPLIFYFLKRKDEKKQRDSDLRLTEYRRFLTSIQQLDNGANLNLNEFYQKFQSIFVDVAANPNRMDELGPNLVALITSLLRQNSEFFIRITEDLQGLRLICSEKLLTLIDEYVRLQKEISDTAVNNLNELLKNYKSYAEGKQFVVPDSTEKGNRSRVLKEQILIKMRQELQIK